MHRSVEGNDDAIISDVHIPETDLDQRALARLRQNLFKPRKRKSKVGEAVFANVATSQSPSIMRGIGEYNGKCDLKRYGQDTCKHQRFAFAYRGSEQATSSRKELHLRRSVANQANFGQGVWFKVAR